MKILRLASCMAENSELLSVALCGYAALRVGVPIEYVGDSPWEEREQMFDAGLIHILWLCGLPYVHKADLADSNVELLAVPVPSGDRYASQPVYFSDVIVRRDTTYHSLRDLRGASWAYNEPRSHSGYNLMRARLASMGEAGGFFGKVIEAGSHSRSLQMVCAGEVDSAAIDSTVLHWLGAQRPALMDQLRVIDVLGPSPIPPWVISTEIESELGQKLRKLFLTMHEDVVGREILSRGGLERFVAAADEDYNPIRVMARAAENVSLI